MELAGCIIRDTENKILLIHRGEPDQWEIPGGKFEEGEQAEEAAIRELKEELGVTIEVLRLIAKRSFEHQGRNFNQHWLEARIIEGELMVIEEELHNGYRFFSLDELRGEPRLSRGAHNLVQALMSQEIIL